MAEAFADLLRNHRLRRRFTQEALAERAGISSRSVREMERGRGPRAYTVEQLAAALELDEHERERFVEAGRTLFWANRAGRLDGAGPARPAPLRQLPPDLPDFVGRDQESAALDKVLHRTGGTRLTVVCGPPGVGKTALAVHWAHKVSDQFPDGQLYTNLQGFAAAAAVRPIDALARFLQALGVPAEEIPSDLGAAAGMYRSLLADKRVLILLDNAESADQVRPLLPAGSGCCVLITSRHRLTGLVALESAQVITLDVLPFDDARALIVRAVGTERVEAEPQAAAELVRLCVGLPLALRIAAAHLISEPQWTIGGYTTSLSRRDRIAALYADDDEQAAVRAAFDQSYTALAPEARRLFRLTGLAPVRDLTPAAAAALAEVPVAEAERQLDRLTAAHLIQQHLPRRFASHDLLRLYAATRAEEEDDEPARRAAAGRLLSWYAATVDTATRLLYPGRRVLVPPAPVSGQPPATSFAAARDALEWLDAERVNLVNITRYSAEHGPQQVAWQIAGALSRYFWNRGHAVDWLATASAGRAAAEAAGDLAAQAAAQLNLSLLNWRQGQFGQAVEHCQAGLGLAQRAGRVDIEAAALGQLGGVYRQAGRPKESIEPLTRALALERAAGRVEPSNIGRLGSIWWELGRLSEAAECQAQAYAMYEAIGARDGQAIALANLGETEYLLGRHDSAVGHLDQALALYREAGNRAGEAGALCCLARIHSEAGKHTDAVWLCQTALDLAQETGLPRDIADVANAFGAIQHNLGRPQLAEKFHRQALDIARTSGYRYPEAESLVGLAAAQHRLGSSGQALEVALEAIAIVTQSGYRVLECQTREILAEIHRALGDAESAAAEAREAEALHDDTGYRRGPRQ